jgi:hypothetical protein
MEQQIDGKSTNELIEESLKAAMPIETSMIGEENIPVIIDEVLQGKSAKEISDHSAVGAPFELGSVLLTLIIATKFIKLCVEIYKKLKAEGHQANRADITEQLDKEASQKDRPKNWSELLDVTVNVLKDATTTFL